jgi:threonine dehydratase
LPDAALRRAGVVPVSAGEPGQAGALAAVLTGKIDVRGGRVGVTLSGGNVDLARFCTLLTS